MQTINLRILQAFNFAAYHHSDQRRKGKRQLPYVNHLIEVAHLLAQANADEDTIIAGILHDSVEDVGVTFNQLETVFGAKVAGFVKEVTDDKSDTKLNRKKDQVKNTHKKSLEARMIKLADKTSNILDTVRDPPVGWTEEQKMGYAIWSFFILKEAKWTSQFLEDKLLEAIKKFVEVDAFSEDQLLGMLYNYYDLLERSLPANQRSHRPVAATMR